MVSETELCAPFKDVEQIRAFAKAMNHPVRYRVLIAVLEKSDVSVRQIASRLDVADRRVRPQLRILLEAGFVEVSREEKRSGVVQRFYSPCFTPFLETHHEQFLEDGQLLGIYVATVKLILADMRAASKAETFSSSRSAFVRDLGLLDDIGWQKLKEIHERAAEEIVRAFEESKQRLDSGSEPEGTASFALFFSEVPAWRPDGSDR